MPHFGPTRARDEDRDAVVDALGTAYSQGQIGPLEHEKRVGKALQAVRLVELERVVADLHLPEDHPALEAVHRARRTVPARFTTPAPPAPRGMPRWQRVLVGAAAVVGGAAVLLVGIGVVASVTDDAADEPKPPVQTVEGMAELVEAVGEEFGSPEVIAAEIHDTWAYVLIPAGGNRFERYTWSRDGEGFSRHQGGTVNDARPDLVDLADVDAEQLVENIERARAELGVEDVDDVQVTVTDAYGGTMLNVREELAADGADPDVPAHVEIAVSNDFGERATLATDLTGDRVLDRSPYEPPAEAGG